MTVEDSSIATERLVSGVVTVSLAPLLGALCRIRIGVGEILAD